MPVLGRLLKGLVGERYSPFGVDDCQVRGINACVD